MIYGIRAVMEAIQAGNDLEKVFIQANLKGDLLTELRELIRQQKVPFSKVPVEKINRFTLKNHQGVVAFVSPVKYQPLDELIARTFESGQTPLFILLDGVTDVRNFGSIARTAECSGVHGLVIPTQGSAQVNADAVKTSAGAFNYLPVCREPNIVQAAAYLQSSGLRLVACTEKAGGTFDKVDLTGPTCLVLGAEDVGISPELLRMADEQAKIQLKGKIASLNVGAAAAMVLYEVIRQRG
jgi:23S rRNA (guanosine2251-2'-O)-methyltransferase